MIKENKIKQRLQRGENVVGTFVKMTDPSSVEMIANAGFDFIAIDNEHTSMNRETVVNLIRTSEAYGIVSTVRVRENDRAQILQALDAGSYGVMVPETSTRREVELVVERTKYAPMGKRGYSASQRSANYSNMDPREYAEFSNANTMVIAYCETAAALENLDDMLAVDGVDVMFVGPFDLTQALGVIGQPKHPKVLETIDMVVRKVRAAGKAAGIISPNPAETKRFHEQGFQYVIMGSDQAFIQGMGKAYMKELRG
ncbi:MAG: 2-dehydro-3-deoxyglucarate aldolase [Alphaproteobacteria bacterium]|nr:2-dehydro-3-deoxyglucarate aldolase [Alphaproteobacteria bacterium]MDE2161742.1 2-dehydro-3-deoxyglucarate aldolase [Alphaproteobacteria bacterium]